MRIFLSRPHMSGLELRHVTKAFQTNYIAPVGPQLDEFEAGVEEYLGGSLHCVAVSSGTAALHLALRIAGVESNDSVWVSSMTFAGGVFPILYLGAIPTFFDLDLKDWGISASVLAEELLRASASNDLPKAIIATDLYGQSSNLEELEALADNYGVKLIVDSAESLGAETATKRKAGSGGDAAILSFNGNKIITTSGGGMFVTKHKKWADEARFLSTQARDSYAHYQHSTYGYNYRLSNICASIGVAQLKVLDERVTARRKIFKVYNDALSMPGISFMPQPEGYYSTRWLTALTIDEKVVGVSREDIRRTLLAHEIETRPLWKPMHMQPLFSDRVYVGNRNDEYLFEKGICLPSGSDLTEVEQAEVIGRILYMLENSN